VATANKTNKGLTYVGNPSLFRVVFTRLKEPDACEFMKWPGNVFYFSESTTHGLRPQRGVVGRDKRPGRLAFVAMATSLFPLFKQLKGDRKSCDIAAQN
jgi:hypothetical protein